MSSEKDLSTSSFSPPLKVNLKNFTVSTNSNNNNQKEEKNKNNKLLNSEEFSHKNFWKMFSKSNKKISNKSPVYTISPAGRSLGTFDLQLKKPGKFVYFIKIMTFIYYISLK